MFLGWEAGHRPGQVWRCTHQVKCATHCHPLENFAVYHNFIIIIINNELNNACGQNCQIRAWILLWQNNVYTQNSHGWRQKATMSRLSSPLCICVLFYQPNVTLLLNPLSPNINIQILQTGLYTFPLRISWENLI